MYKYPVITRTTLFFLCLFFLLWGCGGKGDAPQQPKAVTKKITKKKEAVPTPAAVEQVAKAKPVPVEKPVPKTPAALKPKASVVAAAAAPAAPVEVTKVEEKPAQIVAGETPTAGPAVQVALYSLEGKVDPFEPLFKDEPKVEKAIEKREKMSRVPLTPLEKVDLSQLKLVGIIQSESGNMALVEEASGKGYVIQTGTFIGTHAGRVDKILPNAVIVDEPLLPVEEVNKDSIYEVDGKNFSIFYSEGKRFISIDGKQFEAKISQVDGKSYFVDPKELKLQKPPGEE